MPLVVSEQSPQSLGHTVKDVETYEAVKVITKEQFSMVVPELEETLNTLCGGNLTSVVLCGIEVSRLRDDRIYLIVKKRMYFG